MPEALPSPAPAAAAADPPASSPALAEVSLAPLLSPALCSMCSVIARKTKFPGWKCTREEAIELLQLYDPIFAKYLPQLSDEAAMWIMAVGGTVVFAQVRLDAQVEYEESRAAEAPATTSPAPASSISAASSSPASSNGGGPIPLAKVSGPL